MPLWTIFTKWPAPALPKCAQPFGGASVWLQGSVVRSWLLELAERAFEEEGTDLANIKGWVADSGEGRWTILEAISHDVPATVLAHSLFARFVSRQEDSYAMKVAAALRNQFGGHAVKKE